MSELMKKIINLLPWKAIFREVWKDLEPKLKKKVDASEPKWDDELLACVKFAVERFLA